MARAKQLKKAASTRKQMDAAVHGSQESRNKAHRNGSERIIVRSDAKSPEALQAYLQAKHSAGRKINGKRAHDARGGRAASRRTACSH